MEEINFVATPRAYNKKVVTVTELDLTIRNFRCFEDAEPAIINLRPGVIAFVGANNAGKSSILRLFYELRELFREVTNPHSIAQWLRGSSIGVNLSGVPDPSALRCDLNDRRMTLRVEAHGAREPHEISAVEFSLQPNGSNSFDAQFYLSPGTQLVQKNDATVVGPHELSVSGKRISMAHFAEQIQPLTNTLYIGPFRNALNEGASSYYDLSLGTAFVNLWKQWKNGAVRANNRAIKNVENSIAHLFGFDRLEINPSADNKGLRVFVDDQSFDLHEQGSGLTQFVLAFGAAATRKPAFILIDEPELNLHPTLQVDFLTTLATFATVGTLFSTHSIGLARSTADTIYSVRRQNRRSMLRRYETTPNLVEFAGELSFSSFSELGFDRLLLVEGATDVRTIQQLLRKLDKDHRVIVFPLLGHTFSSGDHEHALQELKRLASAKQIAALVDSERSEPDGKPEARREAFRRTCEKLGFLVHLTTRRAIENYFTLRSIHEAVGMQYEQLEPFERHGTAPKNWSKSLNWRIANALTVAELEGTDLLDFLRKV